VVEHRQPTTIAGTSRAWGIERQTLGRYRSTSHSVPLFSLITRRYSQVLLTSPQCFQDTNSDAIIGTDKSGWDMSSHFNFILAFMEWRSVLLLFNVSAYGRKTQSSCPIGKRYLLSYTQNELSNQTPWF